MQRQYLGQEQAKLFGQIKLYGKKTLEMNGFFGKFVLSVMVHLADKPSGH